MSRTPGAAGGGPTTVWRPARACDLLGQLMQPSLQRGYLLLAVLIQRGAGQLTAEELAEHSRLLAERLALLSGLDAPEFFDTRLFVRLVESLELEGWLWRDPAGRLMFDERLREAAAELAAAVRPGAAPPAAAGQPPRKRADHVAFRLRCT